MGSRLVPITGPFPPLRPSGPTLPPMGSCLCDRVYVVILIFPHCGNLDVAGVVQPWHQLLYVCSLLPLPLPPSTSCYFHGVSGYSQLLDSVLAKFDYVTNGCLLY